MRIELSGSEKKLLVICGPTASGKTALFDQLQQGYPNKLECINADTGQMYRGLSIGTAKPDLQSIANPEAFHLFDILTLGELFSAGRFRQRVAGLVTEIWARGKTPVIVGGSMFYINALFFPPKDAQCLPQGVLAALPDRQAMPTIELYLELQRLDPVRAKAIMPNDRFRILRAFEIWDRHHILPSELEPEFAPLGPTELYFVSPPQEKLDARIAQRLQQMLYSPNDQSWLDEARLIQHCPKTRDFINSSRLIGYKEILSWLDQGAKSSELPALAEALYFATRNYAKKQLKFWRRLEKKILSSQPKTTSVKIFKL